MNRLRSAPLVGALVLMLSAWGYFAFLYAGHLRYIESMQLFLYTGDYVWQTLAHPGGATDLAARFLVQFYHWPVVGGAVVALLLGALALGGMAYMRRCEGPRGWAPLSLIPSLAYWSLMGSENYPLNGLLALVLAVWAAWGYAVLRQSRFRALYAGTGVPLLYLAVGGAALAFFGMVLAAEWSGRRSRMAFAVPTLCLALVLLAARPLFPQLDATALLLGARCFHYAAAPIGVFLVLWLGTALVTTLPLRLPELRRAWMPAVLVLLLFGGGAWGIAARHMALHEEVMRYLAAARRDRWEEVIGMAERHEPRSVVCTVALNLALAETGQLGDRLFDFRQEGTMGLLAPYGDDLLVGGEVLFRLGFNNEAMRYAFEAMASTPDQQRGAFFLLRLAETNLVAGRPAVARRYLAPLGRTLAYRTVARRLGRLADDTAALHAHPFYGRLARLQPRTPFPFNARAFGPMLAQMVAQSPANGPAYDYLLAARLLTKDLEAFSEELIIGRRSLPRAHQEALAMLCRLREIDPARTALPLDRTVPRRLEQYIRSYRLSGGRATALVRDWGHTYWFYHNFIPLP